MLSYCIQMLMLYILEKFTKIDLGYHLGRSQGRKEMKIYTITKKKHLCCSVWLFVLCSVSFDCTMTTKKTNNNNMEMNKNKYIQLHKNIEKEKKRKRNTISK